LDKEINGGLTANGTANGKLSKGAAQEVKEAGAIQLLVALAGIYGSLQAASIPNAILLY
jgi:hypothetical protein